MTAPSSPPSGSHIAELDGLRGIAVLMVLLLHTRPGLFYWGWAGVDLFFVLSGFLITRILLDNCGQPGMLWSFYGRRILRIWPVYYLTLALTACLHTLAGVPGTNIENSVPTGHWLGLVFLQNTEHYFGQPELPYLWYFRHSWSVAVEEQFYLVWPLLLVGFAVRPGRLIALGIMALCAALVARFYDVFIYLLLTRVDGLVLGATVAFAVAGPRPWLHRLSRRHFAVAGAIGVSLVLPYLWLARSPAELIHLRAAAISGFVLLFAVALCAVLRNLGQGWLAWLRCRPLRWVGRISYGLYMYHVPVGALSMLAAQNAELGNGMGKLGMWIGSFIIAHFSYELMEKRILAFRRALPYRLARTASSVPGVEKGAGA